LKTSKKDGERAPDSAFYWIKLGICFAIPIAFSIVSVVGMRGVILAVLAVLTVIAIFYLIVLMRNMPAQR